jgi:hypothetical protein
MLQALGGPVPPNTDHVWFTSPQPLHDSSNVLQRLLVYRFHHGGKMLDTKKEKIGLLAR